MRKGIWILVALGFASAAVGSERQVSRELRGRVVEGLDLKWKFFKGDVEDASKVDYNDAAWETVDVPHDWSIEGAFSKDNPSGSAGAYLPLGVGWYRKEFEADGEQRLKKVFIQFDGIYKNSDVWLNGEHLGKRWYGYASFQYDLTDHINWDGKNVIAVRVDNSEQSCRWYSGSGIYRDVWLTYTERLHVGHWGTYVTTPDISAERAKVVVKTTVKNDYAVPKKCALKTIILDERGRRAGDARSEREMEGDTEVEFTHEIEFGHPILWSAERPRMYSVYTMVFEDTKIVDKYITPFGIRDVKWDSQKGLFVNGESVLLKGVCLHHDLGALGSAFNERAMARRLEALKYLGCNAIRTSHNPPAPQLLDMCDVMGFMVIDEAFDKWGGQGPGHHANWQEDWEKDLLSMIRRDRNHPSIILWSLGNEVPGQETPESQAELKKLIDYAHKVEPSRKVTCGTTAPYAPGFAKLQDVAGLNYQEQWFDKYRQEDANMVIVSTESYAYYRGKGDTHRAFYPMNPWFDALNKGYATGIFVWAGVDYLGEAAAGWPLHGWNGSLIDTCGNPRPVANLHRSLWTDEPMVYIVVVDDSLDVQKPTASHWDWPKMVSHWTLPKLEGKDVKVVTFTNCQSVELTLNGFPLGEKNLADFPDRMISWDVFCMPGSLKAEGKNDGQVVCSDELITAGEAAEIILEPDRSNIWADGRDLCHVGVRIVDKNGIVVPDASVPVDFDVSGGGKIVGVDNGDLWSTEPYKAKQRKAYEGRCMVIVQSNGETEPIDVSASSEGLRSSEVRIQVGR
ncbi:MAG: DUF4982 domain-containing protein [Sedimentisphaerales bacterium]|nr:DUF4982 domain-containing protein [Sedimentisphaerales bacterium]